MEVSAQGATGTDRSTDAQRRAATARGRDVVVTAGAGSGKTRTLVERYVGLLADGLSVRQIAAVTFTNRAAREMRSRVRVAVEEAAEHELDALRRQHWLGLESELDAARISTIHSLCQEVIRAHPAEAAVDPDFEVMDDAQAAALRADAVEEALTWAMGRAALEVLFVAFKPAELRRLLNTLLARRLDSAPVFEGPMSGAGAAVRLHCALAKFCEHPTVMDAVATLRRLERGGTLESDAGEALARQAGGFVAAWDAIRLRWDAVGLRMDILTRDGANIDAVGLASKPLDDDGMHECVSELAQVARELFQLRRSYLDLKAGKKNSVARECVVQIRTCYAEELAGWLKGEKSGDDAPDPAAERLLLGLQTRLADLFNHAQAAYRRMRAERRQLDNDDLESIALALLARPELAGRWQRRLEAVLVDEFQDTNQRQRRIIDALCGAQPGKLFIVGDSRQSIYGFRGADVAVFRNVQVDVDRRGGEIVALDITFRTHALLTAALNRLLAPIMDEVVHPDRPFAVPFSPLISHPSVTAPAGLKAPYLEFVLAEGTDTATGRAAAAWALAARLLDLKAAGEIAEWRDVALLFRASTGFGTYEAAFEAHGIPFVTIAGRGFYGRPEIRDVIGILRALAEPWDDLAMAGLLRSPAFGLSDAALYRLRWPREDIARPNAAPSAPDAHLDWMPDPTTRPVASPNRIPDPATRPEAIPDRIPDPTTRPVAYQSALSRDLDHLDVTDREHAIRAQRILVELLSLVDRLPVADLLKRVLDATDYRAALGTAGDRFWRNLDKLLADAQRSGLVNVRAFLDYLQTLRDVGAREGEAPVDASGAVQLLTVHKAKGQEWEWVVIADANHSARGAGGGPHLMPNLGVAVHPNRAEGANPLLNRLAELDAQQRDDAETRRVLYVAATRARHKLLVSGHVIPAVGASSWKMGGWLRQLWDAADLAGSFELADLARGRCHATADGMVGVWFAPSDLAAPAAATSAIPSRQPWLEAHSTWLYGPIPEM